GVRPSVSARSFIFTPGYALDAACRLFRTAARPVAGHFGYTYPQQDDENVTAHLQHVRCLPRDAQEMYTGKRNSGS
ncbi:MAG: aminoglycoside 6-adenylyltransferase, partial [Anaerolineales bacterium]